MVTVSPAGYCNSNFKKIICKNRIIKNACMLIVALQLLTNSCNLNFYFLIYKIKGVLICNHFRHQKFYYF